MEPREIDGQGTETDDEIKKAKPELTKLRSTVILEKLDSTI